jgi:DNA excision repair protein ERCC-2
VTAPYQVSVRALVEHCLRGGDLDLESAGRSSTLDAIRAHQKVQGSRPEGYQKEVRVARRFERSELSLEVSGRIDGVWERESGPLIEEIKTTRGELPERALEENPTHWGQLKVYACFYGANLGLEWVDTRLTYYQLDSGRTLELERRFRLAELEAFVEELVARYLAFLARVRSWISARDRSLRESGFPFPSYRIGQREMAVSVYRSIREGKALLVRAPTGAGKTHGALFPAVKALGEGETDRIFYLTARTTGRALAETALDQMRGKGVRIRSLTLTAKEKICFNPDKACRAEECDFARGFYDRLPGAMDEALEEEVLTRVEVEALARKHVVCPHELSLELTPLADVVIGDYNHAFDPRSRLRRFFLEGSRASTLLVDEAHHLADRAREMFSASISRESLLTVKRELRSNRRLARAIGKVTASIGSAFREELAPSGPPEELLAALSRFLETSEAALRELPASEARSRLVESVFDAAWFSRAAEGWDETMSVVLDAPGRDRIVSLFCTDPASRLKETFDSVRASALFSGTLSPLAHFGRCLGLAPQAQGLSLPAAFPPENLHVLIHDRIATTWAKRGATEPELASVLAAFVSEREGNYFVYFPSYEYLRSIEPRLALACPEAELLVQEPGMSESARDAFLARFSRRRETLVGLAVMGGIFGEGIDLPGEKLEGAAVVGVGLPALSPRRDLIRERFERTEGAGFDYAYVVPGMSRVLQAAGRVIRSETDRGAVLLIDERFHERRYRSLFPPEWTPRFVRSPEELRRELAEFWK